MTDSNENWILPTYFFFSENTQVSNFTKIRSEGVKLLHVDGRTDRRTEDKQTDMTKLIDFFFF